MLGHQLGERLILGLDLLPRILDPFLFGLVAATALLLEGRRSVLKELLLPPVEHRGLQTQFLAQVRSDKGVWISERRSGWRTFASFCAMFSKRGNRNMKKLFAPLTAVFRVSSADPFGLTTTADTAKMESPYCAVWRFGRKGNSRLSKLLPFLLWMPTMALSQFYNITTIAGNGKAQFSSGGQAANTVLIEPAAVAVDGSGNVYVSDTYFHQVYQITPSGVISAYAGNGQGGFSGDGGPATAAQLFNPRGLATDSSGNLYIADTTNSRVRKVSPGGVINTVVLEGNGVSWVAVDGTGNLYITGGHSVFRADASGNITTIAGTGAAGFSGDGGPATAATLFGPEGLRVDATGNVYVADRQNNRIRKITPLGIISTVAGTPTGGFTGDGGQATVASLFQPEDVSLDAKGNLYICDSQNYRVRVVNSAGVISTVAGGGQSLQNGPPSQALLAPNAIAVDGNGNIMVAETIYREVRRITPQQSVTTIAGVLPSANSDDNAAATSVALLDPFGVAVQGGNVYVADRADNRIRKISPVGIITTVAGNGIPGFMGDGGPASQAGLAQPLDLGIDPSGDLFLTTASVQKITPAGTILAVAGDGTPGFSGNGGPATQASLLGAADAVGDRAGNVYITDKGNNLIRRVDPTGAITTYAGNRTAGFLGDGGPATQAELFLPYQLALDTADNLYIADWGNGRVRKVSPAGTITTVAGGGPEFGPPGDGGPATSATIGGNLFGVAVDAAGNLYITSDARIRKVDATTGIISTIAGTGTAGFSGDGGWAGLATVSGPQSIAVDSSGNVYFSDESNYRVRMLTPAQIVKEAVVNGATFQAGGVSPGEIVTIYGGPGVSLGPAAPVGLQLDSAGEVATMLAGTQVTFDGVAAPLLYLSASQINVVVPYEVAGKPTTVLQVGVQGNLTNAAKLPVVATSPGIFAITNQDGTVNSSSNPVAAGGILVLYGTGEGQTSPAGIDGGVNSSAFPKPLGKVSIQIGGQPAQILYAGAAPGFVAGVLQVDVQIPAGVSGTVPLQLTVGGASTPTPSSVTIK